MWCQDTHRASSFMPGVHKNLRTTLISPLTCILLPLVRSSLWPWIWSSILGRYLVMKRGGQAWRTTICWSHLNAFKTYFLPCSPSLTISSLCPENNNITRKEDTQHFLHIQEFEVTALLDKDLLYLWDRHEDLWKETNVIQRIQGRKKEHQRLEGICHGTQNISRSL